MKAAVRAALFLLWGLIRIAEGATPTFNIFAPGPSGQIEKSNGTYILQPTTPSDYTTLFGCGGNPLLFMNGGGTCTSPSGSGTVPFGNAGQFPYYAITGNALYPGNVGPGIQINTGVLEDQALINAQTGTTYTYQTTDAALLITRANASAMSDTLPSAATTGFTAGFSFDVQNIGPGTLTITPTTSTINAKATLIISANNGCSITSDGTNYQVSACSAIGTGQVIAGGQYLGVPAFGSPGSPGTTPLHIDNYNPLDYGAKCDATTDDTAVLNALSQNIAQSYLGTGNIVQPPGKSCLVNSANLNLARGVALVGQGMPLTATNTNPGAFVPFILLNPSYTVQCNVSTKIENMVIMRAGLAAKPANAEAVAAALATWGGDNSKGITVNGPDCELHDVQVIGFNYGVYGTSGARLLAKNIYCDDYACMNISGVGDNAVIENVRGRTSWSSNIDEHIDIWGTPTVVAAGTGYTTGNVLTVPGGTCATQPTLTVTASGGNITGLAVTDVGDCTVSPQTYVVTAGTIVGGGSGYAANSTFNVTLGGGQKTVAAVLSVSTNGSGVITTVNSVVTPGTYSEGPPYATGVTGGSGSGATITPTMGKLALALTGGSGTGATATVSAQTTNYRGGECVHLGPQYDGSIAKDIECEEYQTALHIDNIWNARVYGGGGEGGVINYIEHHTTGILSTNCVSETTLINPQADTQYIGLDLQQRTAANGGNCTGATNSLASLTVMGGHVAVDGSIQTGEVIHLATGTNGELNGVNVGSFGGAAGIVVDATVLNWQIIGLVPSANVPFPINLYSIAAASVPYVSFGAETGLANTWTAQQIFGSSEFCLLGSSTGCTSFASANAGATNYTLTFPALTDTVVTQTTMTGPTVTATNNFVGPLGSTSSVPYSATGNVKTGIYFPTLNQIAGSANGNESWLCTGGQTCTFPGNVAVGGATVGGAGSLAAESWLTGTAGRAVNTGTTSDTIAVNAASTYESANTNAGAFTLTLAAPVGDGERRRVCFKNAVSALTWNVTSPATATAGLPALAIAGQCMEIIYNSTSGTPANAPATTWLPY